MQILQHAQLVLINPRRVLEIVAGDNALATVVETALRITALRITAARITAATVVALGLR